MPHVSFCPLCNAPHEIVVDVQIDCIACKQTFIAIMPVEQIKRTHKPLLVCVRSRINRQRVTIQITNWSNYTERSYRSGAVSA